jgi:glycosyltransferase involved in cell wall biosynthesis
VTLSNSVTRPEGARDAASPTISVIVPVRDGAEVLARCLEALRHSQGVAWECIVVDDGSTDDSATIARDCGARVLHIGLPGRGPGQARNLGARAARAPLLCFLDADVLVRADTLAQFVALFEADAGLAAAFGSYDAQPDAPDVLSQYRNLLHHVVHQSGQEAASTFWAGCGAIRRSTFLAIGGFDPEYTRPSIEDIELGYRLRAAGARIRLAKHIQVTHLKRWTFWAIVKTDVRDRALPWTALILRNRRLPNDLNLQTASRASAVSVYALLALVALGWCRPVARPAALLPLAVLLTCNRRLYAFFVRERGPWFLLRVLPMHWLYYAYSGLAFGLGMLSGLVLDRCSDLQRATLSLWRRIASRLR